MFQYRQALVRLRAGDTAREIARSGLIGRDKLTELARLARVSRVAEFSPPMVVQISPPG